MSTPKKHTGRGRCGTSISKKTRTPVRSTCASRQRLVQTHLHGHISRGSILWRSDTHLERSRTHYSGHTVQQRCRETSSGNEKAPALSRRGFRNQRRVEVYLRVPTTSTSTRRFLARPSRVALSATGWVKPLPSVYTRLLSIPLLTKKAFTASARRTDSAWL